MANWTDAETRELLAVRADQQIVRLFTGTVKDSHLLERIARTLAKRGVKRTKKQLTSKLKVLKKRFHQVSELDQQDWPFFELCSAIWGSGGHPVNPARSLASDGDDESPGTSSCAAEEAAAEVPAEMEESVDERDGSEAEEKTARTPTPPPRRRRRSRVQDVGASLDQYLRSAELREQRELEIMEQQLVNEREWFQENAASRQRQLEAIENTQLLLHRHLAMMENLLSARSSADSQQTSGC